MTHMRLSNLKGSVIKSLGEDISVVFVGGTVAQSRRQRMVAHNITDASFSVCRDGTVQSVLSRKSFDRVFRGVVVRCAIRQSQGGARLRDGNSGQSGGYQELNGE